VFNNAGIAGAQLPLHELPVDDWQQVRAINAWNAARLCTTPWRPFPFPTGSNTPCCST